jgi:hypothetical protein
MKTKLLVLITLLLGAIGNLHAQGYIVTNGVTYAGIFQGGGGYGINVVHNPTNGDSTGFSLDPLGKTPSNSQYTNTYRFDPIVDVGVRVFMVSSNTAISLQPILSQSWTELVANQNGYVFANGVPFYLAIKSLLRRMAFTPTRFSAGWSWLTIKASFK